MTESGNTKKCREFIIHLNYKTDDERVTVEQLYSQYDDFCREGNDVHNDLACVLIEEV